MIFDHFYLRFFAATVLWLVSWPILWFIKIGEIFGPKAWFWIIGELNYPVVAVAYFLLDSLFNRLGLKPWMIFVGSVSVIALGMPFYYQRYGFALGVTLEARFF